MAFRDKELQKKRGKKYAAFYCSVIIVFCFVLAVKDIMTNPVDWTECIVCGIISVYTLYLRFKLQ